MTRDDHVWGSRSAIQKAVRRGDLDLAHTALTALWSDHRHKGWLRWRVMSIIQEDCLPMVGEAAALLQKIKTVEKDSAEELSVWRKFFYRCCLCPAMKDAAGLMNLAREPEYSVDHPEFRITSQFAARLATESISDVAASVEEWALRSRPLSNYEKEAIRLLRQRSAVGGMVGDQMVPIAAIPIIVYRGMDPDSLKDAVKEGSKKWEAEVKRSKPKAVALPWYCFDMHTQVGKIALGAIARREKIDKDVLFRIWFMSESAKHPRWHVNWSKVKSHPSMFETMWWREWLKVSLAKTGMEPVKVLTWWRDELGKKVQGMVEYLLRVREKEVK